MIRGSLARRYARALMAIGQETGKFEKLGKELDDVASLAAQNEELGTVLKAPVIGKDAREKVIDALAKQMGLDEVTERFLKLLNQKGRLPFLDQIALAYREMADEAEGRERAEVITAAPLSADAQARIEKALAGITGKTIMMDVTVDDSLIGGVVARVAGKLLDGSVKTQLKAVSENLVKTGLR